MNNGGKRFAFDIINVSANKIIAVRQYQNC